MENIDYILKAFKERRYKINSPNNIDVGGHNVQLNLRKGRKMYICDCENSSYFSHNQTCWHIEFFIVLPFLQRLNNEIERKKIYYSGAALLEKEVNPEYVLTDLEELKI